MAKKNRTILGIFIESIGLYFSNFSKFINYMTFPVLGQVFGLILIFGAVYFYSKFYPALILQFSWLDNFNLMVLFSILVTLPGMIVFLKAFWEYLVAYGAINSMLENMLKSGRVYDFDAHTELVKRQTPTFIGLWILIGMFSIIAIVPIFWIPAGVIGIFCILIFQAFTFEDKLSPIGCVRKSFSLIKGNFLNTFMLLMLVILLTYFLIPQLIQTLCNISHTTDFLSSLIKPFLVLFPVDTIQTFLISLGLKVDFIKFFSDVLVASLIGQIFIQYTLPLRSILWSMWYKELNGGLTKIELKKKTQSRTSKSKIKRPSEQLMKNSHKKFVTKKIDRNILKRAMEKDDEA